MKNITKTLLMTAVAVATGTGSLQAQWVQEPVEAHPFFPVFFTASYGGKLWAVGNGGVASSSDNGATFTNLTAIYPWAGTGGNSNREAVFGGSTIYVRTTTQSVFRSLDGGTTWDQDTVGIGPGKQVDMIFFDGTTVFCAINWPDGATYRKTPAAASWTKIPGVGFASGMAQKGGKLYLFSGGTLYTSADGGTTWLAGASVATGTTYAGTTVHVIGSTIFAGNKKSADDGATWTDLPYSGTAYYADGTRYYIGFGPMGGGDSVAVTADGGATWSVSGGGGLSNLVTSITRHNGAMYASIWLRGQLIKNGVNSTSVGDLRQHTAVASVYPNPSAGLFTIESAKSGEFHVCNILGNQVHVSNVAAGATVADLSQQPSGMYFYTFTNGDGEVLSGKLLLQK